MKRVCSFNNYKEESIKTIGKYHNILRKLKEENYEWDSISEYDSVYQDILDYEDNQYDGWHTKDFRDFITYLERLTKVKKENLK